MKYIPGLLKLVTRREIRTISSFVRKMRILEHWSQSDAALTAEFPRAQFALMIDRRPLMKFDHNKRLMCLRFLHYNEMKRKLEDYGLTMDIANSTLLDAVENTHGDFTAVMGEALRTIQMPEDSPISIDELRGQLANSLGGTFVDLRRALLTICDDRERNLLAKMQSLTRWSRIYRRCPKCASPLRMRISKTAAACVSCDRVYYPTVFPVAICLVTNKQNTHAVLIRHQGTVNMVYTAIAGFAHMGESLIETVRREVAEEVGIECSEITQLNISQSWPIPEGSLMCAFRAVADSAEKLNICVDELDAARWFSRHEVKLALENTLHDPQLRGALKGFNGGELEFKYIPPHGAIAHQIIKMWVDEK